MDKQRALEICQELQAWGQENEENTFLFEIWPEDADDEIIGNYNGRIASLLVNAMAGEGNVADATIRAAKYFLETIEKTEENK